jgi:hypothetical protein
LFRSLFVTPLGTCAGNPNYDPCANFAGNTECVDASDLSVLATHLGHSWNNPVFKPGEAAGAVTRLRVEPGGPAGLLTVSVRLEGLAGRSVFGVVLRPSTRVPQRAMWIPRAGLEATTAAVDTLDAQGRRVAVVALAVEPDAAGRVELGSLVFESSGGDVTLADLPVAYEDVVTQGAARIEAGDPQALEARHAPALLPSVPNPFNPSTEIRYVLGEEADVRITIYDIAGHEVRELVRARQVAGEHAAAWEGRDDAGRTVASGVYWVRLVGGGVQRTAKLVVVR